ncbi:MAG TPA: SDR family oxidoreductase, partial [Acidimicrobiia bacterium]|nr:SDR family oxidoreductase [Acidimicrobiia bacterium]
MHQRVALITGASQGLGLALAAALATDGWTLVIDARRADRLATAAAELATHTTVVAIPGDVADPAHRDRLAAAVDEIGRLDLLVNNASTLGASPLPPLDAIDLDLLRQVYEVNVVAPLALTQQLVVPLGAAH